jgi:hypothetical protein
VEIGIDIFGGCFINMARMPRKVFPMMLQNGESSFVKIGMATFEGCFGNMARMPRKVFPMMSQNGESSL